MLACSHILRNFCDLVVIYYDYLDGQPSFDFEGEYNDGNISENVDKLVNLEQEIEQETKLEENIFQIDEDVHELRTNFNLNEEKLESLERKKKAAKKATTMIFEKASEPKVTGKSSTIGSDLWTVQQWIKHG